MAQQHFLQQHGVAICHTISGRLVWNRIRRVSRSRRSGAHVNGNWNVKLLRKFPVRFESRILRGYSFILRREFSECFDTPCLKLFAEPCYVGKIRRRVKAVPPGDRGVAGVARKDKARCVPSRICLGPDGKIGGQCGDKRVTEIQCRHGLRRSVGAMNVHVDHGNLLRTRLRREISRQTASDYKRCN